MSLQTRVVAILTKPADEWRTIASEPATVEGLLRGYAAPLAAIQRRYPVSSRFSVIGITVPVFGGAIRIGLVRAFHQCSGVLGVCAGRLLDRRRGN